MQYVHCQSHKKKYLRTRLTEQTKRTATILQPWNETQQSALSLLSYIHHISPQKIDQLQKDPTQGWIRWCTDTVLKPILQKEQNQYSLYAPILSGKSLFESAGNQYFQPVRLNVWKRKTIWTTHFFTSYWILIRAHISPTASRQRPRQTSAVKRDLYSCTGSDQRRRYTQPLWAFVCTSLCLCRRAQNLLRLSSHQIMGEVLHLRYFHVSASLLEDY